MLLFVKFSRSVEQTINQCCWSGFDDCLVFSLCYHMVFLPMLLGIKLTDLESHKSMFCTSSKQTWHRQLYGHMVYTLDGTKVICISTHVQSPNKGVQKVNNVTSPAMGCRTTCFQHVSTSSTSLMTDSLPSYPYLHVHCWRHPQTHGHVHTWAVSHADHHYCKILFHLPWCNISKRYLLFLNIVYLHCWLVVF